MPHDKGSAEELVRLQQERDDADRRYNEALTHLDAVVQKPRESPHAPPPYDEFQITPLNERWELLSLKPDEGRGWLRRFRTHAWAMVAPLFERQQAFNSALVDHMNRNVATHRETARALDSALTLLREDHRRLVEFQSLLVMYAQQITPYVDTKDRHVAGLMHGVAAGISGLSDEVQKRWESMLARERRYDAKLNDLSEVRTTLGVMQRAVQTVKRELEQRSGAMGATSAMGATGAVGATGAGATGAGATGAPIAPNAPFAPTAPSLDSYKYVGFEDQFRGSQDDIGERVAAYVPLFEGASDVLDVGCGRGEFLALLKAKGISARGVDLNDEMAAVCRERGLDATAGDALSYLLAQPDQSLGGLFAAQVVEHLEPDYLMRFLEAAYHKLRPGSKIVLETINAACWYAFFSSYIRDITHVRPLHPDTLKYLVSASGFQKVSVRFTAPFPEQSKLQTVAASADKPESVEVAFNENVNKLNDLLFTYLDYAAVGERL
ncbi:MAG TPA: class I SAM-dependent methyltransferase [Vicinamibacterales bacterium]|nr:class I SAM-dependent methyltransferase [Vicinamibacterales bacterium]